MFDEFLEGNRSKRRVNLSGSRAPTNRGAFTATLQKQRELREATERRTKAVLYLQRFVRCYLQLRRIKNDFRASVDLKIHLLLSTSTFFVQEISFVEKEDVVKELLMETAYVCVTPFRLEELSRIKNFNIFDKPKQSNVSQNIANNEKASVLTVSSHLLRNDTFANWTKNDPQWKDPSQIPCQSKSVEAVHQEMSGRCHWLSESDLVRVLIAMLITMKTNNTAAVMAHCKNSVVKILYAAMMHCHAFKNEILCIHQCDLMRTFGYNNNNNSVYLLIQETREVTTTEMKTNKVLASAEEFPRLFVRTTIRFLFHLAQFDEAMSAKLFASLRGAKLLRDCLSDWRSEVLNLLLTCWCQSIKHFGRHLSNNERNVDDDSNKEHSITSDKFLQPFLTAVVDLMNEGFWSSGLGNIFQAICSIQLRHQPSDDSSTLFTSNQDGDDSVISLLHSFQTLLRRERRQKSDFTSDDFCLSTRDLLYLIEKSPQKNNSSTLDTLNFRSFIETFLLKKVKEDVDAGSSRVEDGGCCCSNDLSSVLISIYILLTLCLPIISQQSTTSIHTAAESSESFNTSMNDLLRHETLKYIVNALETVPENQLLLILIILSRIYFPLQRHPWFLGSTIRSGRCDFFESTEIGLLSDDSNTSIDEPDDKDDDEEEEEQKQMYSDDKQTFQEHLDYVYGHLPEEITYSQQAVRYFSSSLKFINSLIRFFSNKLKGIKFLSSDIIQQTLLNAPSLPSVLPLIATLSILLEYRARQIVDEEEQQLYWKLQQTFNLNATGFSSAIYLMNRTAVALIELLYGCQPCKASKMSFKKEDFQLFEQTTSILCRNLRDIYRLRPSILDKRDWLVPNQLLKSTDVLLQQLEKGRSVLADGQQQQLNYLTNSAILPIPKAKKTLSLLILLLPHTIELKSRNLLLQLLCTEERVKSFGDFRNPYYVRHGVPIHTKRSTIIQDTLLAEKKFIGSWKNPLEITFYDEAGNREMGIDGGGLFREYLICISKSLFAPNYGLFIELADHSLIPNSCAQLTHGTQTCSLFHLAGSILGKALYEQLTLNAVLNRTFLNLIQNRETQHIEDLAFLDPDLFKHLQILNSFEDVRELQLTFSVTKHITTTGLMEEIDLVPNGRNLPVTNANRSLYVGLLTEYKLLREFKNEAQLMRDGITKVIPPQWISMFDASELSQLLSGEKLIALDIDDLRNFTEFSGGYTPESPTIQNLWEILASLSLEEKKLFLMFVTSCPRPPFLGFIALHPRFSIHCIESIEQLPSASTCLHQLNLPNYKSKQQLHDKLLLALNNAQGFHLA